MATPKLPSLEELLKAGVHFGHKKSRWHPKMEPLLFGSRNGVHIIDLTQTNVYLKKAMDFITTTVARGGTVLFLGTKRQARESVSRNAISCEMPYVTGRWLGGMLTNFSEVIKLVKRLRELKEKQASGELERKYKKKEVVKFEKEIQNLEDRVGGIQNMTRPPEAIFVVDAMKEKTAVQEARVKNIPIIALADSNINPEKIEYPIPANDDAIRSIELMSSFIALAVKEGQAQKEKAAAAAPVNKPVKAAGSPSAPGGTVKKPASSPSAPGGTVKKPAAKKAVPAKKEEPKKEELKK